MTTPGAMAPGGSARLPRVAVVDYGAANMVSITKALAAVGADVSVASSPRELVDVEALVVPGVGAARFAMDRLGESGLVEPIREWVASDRPLLGICLGFQILFDSSEEGDTETLGLLEGRCVELADAPTLPHIGWNSVFVTRPHRLFDGVPNCSHFYFVHSYVPVPSEDAVVLGRTSHGRPFVSAVAKGPLFGLQFHPEKSSDAGLRVLANFVAIVDEIRAGVPVATIASSGEAWSQHSPEVC